MNEQERRKLVRHDPSGLRACRVIALKDLVGKSVYEIPSEDVAASIMRDAIVITAPTPAQSFAPRPDQPPLQEH